MVIVFADDTFLFPLYAIYELDGKNVWFWAEIFGNTHPHFWPFFAVSSYIESGDKKVTILELMEEQRRRINSGNPVERLAAALLIPSELAKRLSKLDDREIGELLDQEVGAKLSLLAPESTVCDAAVTRLRRRIKGLPERKRFGIRRKNS